MKFKFTFCLSLSVLLSCQGETENAKTSAVLVSAQTARLKGIMHYPDNVEIERIQPYLSCFFCNFVTCDGSHSVKPEVTAFKSQDVPSGKAIAFEVAEASLVSGAGLWKYKSCTYDWEVVGTFALADGRVIKFSNPLHLAGKAAPEGLAPYWNAGQILSPEHLDRYQDFTIDFDIYDDLFTGVYRVFVVD